MSTPCGTTALLLDRLTGSATRVSLPEDEKSTNARGVMLYDADGTGFVIASLCEREFLGAVLRQSGATWQTPK
jgi:hypothetical protein